MTCGCGAGTVWFDHAKKRWSSSDHRCAGPEPRHCGQPVSAPAPVRRVARRKPAAS